MKQRKTELDVDFIGGQGPLTEIEQKLISEYIKAQKSKREKKELNHRARKSLKTTRGKLTVK